MSNTTPIPYKGNRRRVEIIKTLAMKKNMTLGALVASAVDQVYGEELQLVEASLLALSDRLNEQSPKRTRKQRR